MAGSGQIFLSWEESRTKQSQAIKGIFGDERTEHPSDWWMGTLCPQKLVSHPQPGNSKLGFLGKMCALENCKFPEWEGSYFLKPPLRALLSSEAREEHCKETHHLRGRKIPSPPLAPPITAWTEGRKRLILLRQAAWETDWHCASKDRTWSSFPHSLSWATAIAKVSGTTRAALSTQQQLFHVGVSTLVHPPYWIKWDFID